MLVNIDDIKVKNRVRKDLGNLEPLKDSLRTYGLMNPITITADNELIAGERRLESAKQLGWSKINANVITGGDQIKRLEMELEENNQRKEFTDDELLEGYRRLERLRNPTLPRRIWNAIREFFAWLGNAIASLFRHGGKKQKPAKPKHPAATQPQAPQPTATDAPAATSEQPPAAGTPPQPTGSDSAQ